MKKQNFFLAHKQFTLFFILALVIVGVAVFAPWVAPKDPLEAVMLDSLKAPCAEYPLGADKLGRDLLSRVIYGTRTSLVSTLILVATIFVVGTLLGIIAGYFGGWIDQVIMRIADMMISFPGMILAIAIAGMLGPSLRNGVIAITAVSWTKIRPSGKKYGFESEAKPVCGSCRCKRYRYIKNSLETHSSEYADNHDGNGSGRYGNHDARTGISFFPGIWCSCTDTGMGTDAE